jgi:hypothetical protein
LIGRIEDVAAIVPAEFNYIIEKYRKTEKTKKDS